MSSTEGRSFRWRTAWATAPPGVLSSEDVVRASSCLAATPFDELARHYDLAAMGSAEIYLLPASEAEVPSDLDTLQHRYQELTRFSPLPPPEAMT
ncbi:DUF1877 family protein [Streptomyces lavendulocolor]|uniref:DUF1877 family protein n=1 Tax=Streptomyces lavendulocolor TaxID=67316 RepID=UPI0033D7BDD4